MVATMMDKEKQQKLQARLEKLTVAFAEKLPLRLAAVRRFFDDNITSDSEAEVLIEMQQQVHALAGTTGSFGYTELSNKLRELEQVLDELARSTPILIDTVVINEIDDKISSIEAATR